MQEAAQSVGVLAVSALTTVVVAAKAASDYYRGKKRDKSHATTLKDGFESIRASIDARFAETNAGIAEVRAFCVGPDGKNGFRKDIETLTRSVDGLIDRERERLAEDRLHGYDRRAP